MAQLTLSNIFYNLKNPAIVSCGVIAGMSIKKLIDKLLNTETVVSGLGAESVSVLKQYASPIITSVIGVGVSISSESDFVKKLSTGVAIYGGVDVLSRFVWGKNILEGTDGGLLGSIMGDDSEIEGIDDEDFEGIDDDFDGYEEIEGIEEEEMEGLDIPFAPPALRDTNYERETISGYDGYGVIA